MAAYSKILIANRGEIAIRVARTAKAMGYRCVAVFSDADAAAAHVSTADEAARIGPAEPAKSYLSAERILEAAKKTGADAVHPGYGFLSENAVFVRACEDAGLVFIGPPADAVSAMGDKARAKRVMQQAGVPCIPGYEGEDCSDAGLISAANSIGFPIMVKAAAGGGGRGMRSVATGKELPGALKAARAEAENAFGTGQLIVEKAIERPRHIEIQIFADNYGNIVHFGERDCSVQRRHQKVIEEAPSPAMSSGLRKAMGAAATKAARAVGYRGAGTVEFLLDEEKKFYFLEMNTRLQVEHPVTELISACDLVEWQLRIAAGEPLPLRQHEISIDGAAIEARLYAENPYEGFLPAAGRVELWRPPEGPHIRVDHALATGQEISPHYDPMMAKVIAWGSSREDARRRLANALKETALIGVPSNKAFLIAALENKAFAAGVATTAFIAEQFPEVALIAPEPSAKAIALAGLVMFLRRAERGNNVSELQGWRPNLARKAHFCLRRGERTAHVAVEPDLGGNDLYVASVDGEAHRLNLISLNNETLLYEADGVRRRVAYACDGRARVAIDWENTSLEFEDALLSPPSAGETDGGGVIKAPMHGVVQTIAVAEGESVKKGDLILTLEAMKMQHELRAVANGVVRSLAAAGDQVPAGAVLATIELD